MELEKPIDEKKEARMLKNLYPLTEFGGGIWKAYFSTYVAMLYTDVYFLPVALSGVLELVNTVSSWFFGPVFGTVLDRFTFKKGKYWQWIMIGSIGSALFYLLIFALPDLSSNPENLAMLVFVLSVFLSLSQSIINNVMISFYPRLADTPKERTWLSMARTVWRSAATALFGVLIPVMLAFFSVSNETTDKSGWAKTGYILSVLGLITYLFFALVFKKSSIEKAAIENRNQTKSKKKSSSLLVVLKGVVTNRPLLVMFVFFSVYQVYGFFKSMTATYFFRYYLNDFAAMSYFTPTNTLCLTAGVLLGIFWLKIFKDSKRAMICAGLGQIAVFAVLTLFLDSLNAVSYIALSGLANIFNGIAQSFLLPLFAAASDYATLKTGTRADGLNMSVYALAIKVGIALSTIIRVAILASAGYDASAYAQGAVPTAQVLTQLANLQTLYPLILAAGAYLMLTLLYPITDAKLKDIKEQIRLRDEAAKANAETESAK